MKKILLLTIIAILSFSAFGQRKFENLTLSLTALKSEVLPLEPIPFKLMLTNNTGASVTVDGSLSFKTASVGLEIKKPNGKIVTPTQLSNVSGRTIFLPKDISAGEAMESTQVFDFMSQAYFDKAGEYQVRASYKNGAGKLIKSEWVNLTIAEPRGMDKAAYELLSKKVSRTYSPFTSWETEDLEEFVLQHPGTTYANYARYRLGERYFERDKEKAEAQFRQIQDSNFIYFQDVSEKLKKLEQQLKKEN